MTTPSRVPNLVEAARAMMAWRQLDWEGAAELFCRDTGYLRPGKDDARRIHTLEERNGEWNNWACRKTAEADDALRQALAALPTGQGPLVCVPAKWLKEAAEVIGRLAEVRSNNGIGDQRDWDLAARLRSVGGEKQ